MAPRRMHSQWWCVRVALFLVMFVFEIRALGQTTDSSLVPVIDVMAVYTSAAQAEAGPALASRIKAAVDDANTVLLNSRARARFRLIHQAKVDYKEPQAGDPSHLELTLDRLATVGDGYLDEVSVLRDQYQADLAVLIVSGGSRPPFSGQASRLNADAEHAFGVTTIPNDLTLVTLLARLLGCEAEVAPIEEIGRVLQPGAFPDSHAYRITNAVHGIFSTLMAVQSWNQLPVFSNPELRILNQPLGEAGKADHVRTLNLRAQVVSAFRGTAGLGRLPTVIWKSPEPSDLFRPGTNLVLEVDAADSDGQVRRVEFFQTDSRFGFVIPGQQPVATVTAAPYRFVITNAPANWHRWVARVTDNHGLTDQAEREFRVCEENDAFARRRRLNWPADRTPVQMAGMTLEAGEPAFASRGVDGTAWFTLISPDEGLLRVQAGPSVWFGQGALPVQAWRGSTLESLSPMAATVGTGSMLMVPVRSGEEVQIAVGTLRANQPEWVAVELAVDYFPVVTNDTFAARQTLAGESIQVSSHNFGVTGEVWWTWTPPESGMARIRFPSFWPRHVYQVFKGDAVDQLESVGVGTAGEWEPPFEVTAGLPLHIKVNSQNWEPSSIDFTLALLRPPPNDLYSARVRKEGRRWSAPALFPAGAEPGEPAGLGPHTLWWEWTAPESGTVGVTAGYELVNVSVFTGNDLTALSPVPGQRIRGGQFFAANAGTVYQITAHWPIPPPPFSAREHVTDVRLDYVAENDAFAERIQLSGAPLAESLPNSLGTAEPGEPSPGAGSLWWSWTSPSVSRVRVWTEHEGSPWGTSFAVYEGDSLGGLRPITTSATFPGVQFISKAGAVYQIAVTSEPNPPDFNPVTLRLSSVAGPENDAFEKRISLGGRHHTLTANLDLATVTPGEPTLSVWSADAGTVWWSWKAPSDGLLRISARNGSVGAYNRMADGQWRDRLIVPPGHIGWLAVTAGEMFEVMLAGPLGAAGDLDLEPRWENDNFSGRRALGPWLDGRPGGQDRGTTQGATREAGEALSAVNASGHSRWWTWRTSARAIARITVTSANAIHAEQFRMSSGGTMERIMWRQVSNGAMYLRFHADPNVEYPLAVDSLDGGDTYFSIDLELTPDGPTPGNDAFANAIGVEGYRVTVQGSHRSATAEKGEPWHAGAPAGRSLWWRWTARESGAARIRARSTSSDFGSPLNAYAPGLLATPTMPRLSVYSGEALDGLIRVEDRQPTTNEFEVELQFATVEGQSYAVALDGGLPTNADVGEFTLEVLQLPTNDQRANRKPLSGAVAQLSGTVTGATREPGDWVVQRPSSWPDPSLMNVWWEWTAPADLRVTLRNANPDAHNWAVWRLDQSGPFISTMDRYFGWEDTRRDFLAPAGSSWLIAVYANPADTTPVDIELEGVPVPDNDDFANRALLEGDKPRVHVRADNASREGGEPDHGIGTISLPYGARTNTSSLWWTWTAPQSGLYRVSTTALPELLETADRWDNVVRADCYVYQGDTLAGLTRVARTEPDTTSPPSGYKEVTFAATAGATYQIAVCPLLVERRVWDTAKFFVDLAIDPAAPNASQDGAIELTGHAPHVSDIWQTGSQGLWWRWTAPASGRVALAQQLEGVPADRWLRIQVYRRDETGNQIPADAAAWMDGWQRLIHYFDAQAGQTYWFHAYALVAWGQNLSIEGPDVPFSLSLSLVRRAADNDNFVSRSLLSGRRVVLVGDNTGATRETGEPLHSGQLGRGSLWWKWTAPTAGSWTLATRTGWAPPLLVGVYRGDSLASLVPAPTLANPIRGDQVFHAEAGETFAIAVDNAGVAVGEFQVDLFQASRPANDDFARRSVLTGPAPVWAASNTGATAEPGEPAHGGLPGAASIWSSWTSPDSAAVLVTVTAGDEITGWGPPSIAVYRGDSIETLALVGENRISGERTHTFVFPSEIGVTYHLALASAPPETGAFQVRLSPSAPPVNDAFAGSLPLIGAHVRAEGLNVAASLEAGEPNPAGPYAGGTLWWSWTAPASGWTTVDTGDSNFDTRLAIYRGSLLPQLNLIAVSDDEAVFDGAPLMRSSRITFNAQGGATYHLQVGGVGSERGQIRLSLVGPDAPLPQLAAPEISEGTFRLELSGTPGQTIWIQSSENLVDWRWTGVLRFEQEAVIWTDPETPAPTARFYRIISPQ